MTEPVAGTAITRAARRLRYSVVIPVFESERIVAETVGSVLSTFDAAGLKVEVVLVNDGSRDGSWKVIAGLADGDPRVVAVNLLRNYGQHHANLAGLREATGDYVITMDDDGQNPPDQALLLIGKAVNGGHDVVFGKFASKQAAAHRRLGSRAIDAINKRVFGQPEDLAVSNFRILRRDVVDRIVESRTAYPYITGQALLYSHDRANVVVEHHPRRAGSSNYNPVRILRLVLTILFSYSVFPMRMAAAFGFAVAGFSMLIGVFYLLRSLVGDTRVPGWTSIIVLLAVLNGVVIALLSMLGEYVVRTLNTVSAAETFHVIDKRDRRG